MASTCVSFLFFGELPLGYWSHFARVNREPEDFWESTVSILIILLVELSCLGSGPPRGATSAPELRYRIRLMLPSVGLLSAITPSCGFLHFPDLLLPILYLFLLGVPL